jgi:hypothetical protein
MRAMERIRRVRAWARRHPGGAAAVAIAGVVLVAAGIAWFEPHKLFLDDRVNEALPAEVVATEDPTPGSTSTPSPARVPATPEAPSTLSRAAFRPLEHDVEGDALVLEGAGGARFLRFDDLEVSNGPDLVVYLSVLGADQGWYDADDAEFIDLGPLKGNIGDQNYRLPAGVDLSRFSSVVIWCRRFTVGFAVAPIDVSG